MCTVILGGVSVSRIQYRYTEYGKEIAKDKFVRIVGKNMTNDAI